ncbi:hypothetical protein [Formosa maritima]|uniref:Uncharacterized protein n=1 Tax=Formosa maritima TaxID=2592046 RepID=A0A5D0GG38_9FLAO|nr:hypothetical protein [Formosa maritima]TYA57259.1 hypothetical protein FVF61_04960 [Formosa maritima]
MYYFIKNRFFSFVFVLFLVFSFVGDFSSVFSSSNLIIKFSSFIYFLGYLTLIFYTFSKFKRIRLDMVIGLYLLIVISINSYFIYELFSILKLQISDPIEVNLFAAKSVSLIALTFLSFVVYLNSDTKQSIIFLLMALCFVFSDVLHYISNYYIYNWSFVLLDRVLHVVGLFFLFNYIIGENRIRKRQIVEERMSSEPSLTLTRQL